ncbi:hypothetical protein Acj9p250 [Acinetobacter phage Acj9]|uniref:Uncharacterized protein n=1 Tax=Acinetobacter phage Acj9 TaxID=760939 RepID=E5EQ34_9CAUD|nr:hypothetical protein Acj9p250 [Acinetobacter phage Acj9]ADG60150.1 hypothetical protein Acj9p250 [Acinetobacter phage Acj9]
MGINRILALVSMVLYGIVAQAQAKLEGGMDFNNPDFLVLFIAASVLSYIVCFVLVKNE